MNLCRCEQGHFYDKEKYISCPHCAGGNVSDEGRTEAFTEDLADDHTIPLETNEMKDDFTIPLAEQNAFMASSKSAEIFQGFASNTRTEPSGGGFLPADDIRVQVSGEDSDDHTVGFFDDLFPGVSGAVEKPSVKQPVSKPPVNKVDTPCVGWMIALGGEHIGTDFRLKVGKNFIGRSPQMDVALTEDKSVSRESHAIVIYEPKAHIYLVQPGESSSLVYRNNEVLLTPVKLEAYDTITVGDVDLLFMPLCGKRFNWEDILKKIKDKNR